MSISRMAERLLVDEKPVRYGVRVVKQRLPNIESYKEQIPNLEIFLDRYGHSFYSFIRALSDMCDDPVVLLEDDVILCDDFVKRVEMEIAKKPQEIIQFFSMRGKDSEVGSRYDNKFSMNQCTYYPPGMCRKLVDFYYDSRWRHHVGSGSDIFVREYLNTMRIKYWIACPSLVQHIEGKSVIDPRRSSRRTSKTFKKEST